MKLSKSVRRAVSIQNHHSSQPERFMDVKAKAPQHDVIKVAKNAKHAGIIKSLRDQGYKC